MNYNENSSDTQNELIYQILKNFYFKIKLFLLNESLTALDFSIDIVETLSTASLNSFVEITKFLVFPLGITL